MFVVEGIHTTIPLHEEILADPNFLEGRFDTTYLNNFKSKFSSGPED